MSSSSHDHSRIRQYGLPNYSNPSAIQSPPTSMQYPSLRGDESPRALNFPPKFQLTVGEDTKDNVLDGSQRPSKNYQGLRITSDPPAATGPDSPLPFHDTPSPDLNQNAATPSETDLLTSGLASRRDRGEQKVHLYVTPRSDRVQIDGAPLGCRSRKPVRTRGGHIRAFIFMLSIYSTLLSGAFFIIAILGPVYDKTLGTRGVISPSTAQIVSTVIARTIELSFVTVFVAFLGQVLVAEAFIEQDTGRSAKAKRGITMGEMAMRTWISEPGTIISEWTHVRHAGLSLLGMLCLTATIMATLYTAASNALVSPKLQTGVLQNTQMYGLVKTQVANSEFIEAQCLSPIKNDPDKDGPTCLQIWHAGQANHAYSMFFVEWSAIGNGSSVLDGRPAGVGLTHSDTSVRASWVDTASSVPAASGPGGRIINNVTMAMPHAGVVAASQDPKNNILQPKGNTGFGEYEVIASVITAAVNVLCVEMSRNDLAPLVFEAFPQAKGPNGQMPNATDWVSLIPKHAPMNSTVVDDIFGWGEKYNRSPPFIYQYPRDWGTILDDPSFGGDSLYFLSKGEEGEIDDSYTLCSLRASLTPECSTTYHASANGGTLTAKCNNEGASYIHINPSAPIWKTEPGWVEIAHKWGNSLGLNEGIVNGNSSNARSLTELILKKPELDPTLPSIAEALAMLAGCTLVDVTLDTTFRPTWSYPNQTLDPPVHEPFLATIRTHVYGSGGNQPWQKLFYPILAGIFLSNAFVLFHMIFYRRDQLTDFTEPLKLFVLAVNSPSSRALEGCCGGGAGKEEYKVRWVVREGKDGHVSITSGEKRGEDVGGVESEEGGTGLFWSPKNLEKRWSRV